MSSLEEQRKSFLQAVRDSKGEVLYFNDPDEEPSLEQAKIESTLFNAYKGTYWEATFRGCPTVVDGSLVGVDADGFAMILGPGMWDAVYRKDSDE